MKIVDNPINFSRNDLQAVFASEAKQSTEAYTYCKRKLSPTLTIPRREGISRIDCFENQRFSRNDTTPIVSRLKKYIYPSCNLKLGVSRLAKYIYPSYDLKLGVSRLTKYIYPLIALGIMAFGSQSCAKDEFLGEKDEPVIEVLDNPSLIENTVDTLPGVNDYPLQVQIDNSDGNILHIINTETNEKNCTLDLNKLVSISNEKRKKILIEDLKTLKPIVLLDIYNELGENGITEASNSRYRGFYNPKTDKIEMNTILNYVFVHNLGHAVSHSVYNSNNVFMPEFANTFIKTFAEENKNFFNITGIEREMDQVDIDDLIKATDEEAYTKASAIEFFADYYKYLHFPETGNRYYHNGDGIMLEWDFYPNSTKLIRQYLNHVRSEHMASKRKL